MSTDNRSASNIIFWAEAEAQVEEFLNLLSPTTEYQPSAIYIAKRSKGLRDVGSRYIEGIYYQYDIIRRATLNKTIVAPRFITDIVQWCSPDLIIASSDRALLSVEITYHEIAFNNVAQRIPRPVRSSLCGVPSLIFQKVSHSKSNQLYNGWFAQTFHKADTIYKAPCLAITFDDQHFEEARNRLANLIDSVVNNNNKQYGDALDLIRRSMRESASSYNEKDLIYTKRGDMRTWLNVNDEYVQINIGVKDNCALTGIPGYGCQGDDQSRNLFKASLKNRAIGEKGCMWLSKGTGGLDPYPGLIKMAEILLCLDERGNKIRQIRSHFSCLPQNFWWFHKNTNSIYYRLIQEFSDRVTYAEDYK